MAMTTRPGGRGGARGRTDIELMRAVQRDDTQAFAELYARLGARATRLARTVCSDRAVADEAVQEGFISVWRSRASYQPAYGEVAAWVLGTVRHRAIDARRSGARHDERRDASEDGAARLPAREDVHDDWAAFEAAQFLRLQLAGLPDAQREALTLAFYGELTHTEIAARLAVPLGTVKGRLRLGMDKLRETVAT
jgi:RNA polymerase sigma-70 factor (ECF subfamily)